MPYTQSIQTIDTYMAAGNRTSTHVIKHASLHHSLQALADTTNKRTEATHRHIIESHIAFLLPIARTWQSNQQPTTQGA
ncbi:hypothetical protein VVR12_01660 [Rothia sp. LK2588]|uniref:hypothetical protein n=1 Tax=Rothia sp. LK2588 TaxID=3114369 RepID=UPI0034CF7E93